LDLKHKEETTEVRLELREGRKREIKRMFKALGHEVLYLKRTRIGPIELGDLPRGAWRELVPEEIATLRTACSTAGTHRTRDEI